MKKILMLSGTGFLGTTLYNIYKDKYIFLDLEKKIMILKRYNLIKY